MYEQSRLKQLVALADFGNFRRAADSLGISHSALSQTIAKMELNYDTPLLIRKYRSITLSEAGHRLVLVARSIIRDLQKVEGEIAAIAKGKFAGKLVIGADSVMTAKYLGKHINKLMISFPNAEINIVRASWHTMEDLLLSREFDIYIGPKPGELSQELYFAQIRPPALSLVCRSNHPLVMEPEQGRRHLRDFNFIGPDLPDRMLKAISSNASCPIIDRAGKIKHVLVDDQLLVREMVRNSDSIGIIFDGEYDLDGGDIKELAHIEFSSFEPPCIVACAKRDIDLVAVRRFFALTAQA